MINFHTLLSIIVLTFGFQSLAQELVGTSGAFSPSSQGSLSWSLGEVVSETYTGSNGNLTTGYQQVFDTTLSIVEVSSQASLLVYPNPFQNNITIMTDDLTANYSVTIIDCQSKVVLEKTIYFAADKKKETLNLSQLVKGYYFLRFHNLSSNEFIIKPIIKLL